MVEGTLENGLGRSIGGVCGGKTKFYGVMFEEISDFSRHDIVILFLAQGQAELWVVRRACLFCFGSEDDHHTVLQEVVELGRVGIEALTVKVMETKR